MCLFWCKKGICYVWLTHPLRNRLSPLTCRHSRVFTLLFSLPSLSLMTNSSRTQACGRTRIVLIHTEAQWESERERVRVREREYACNQPHTKQRARTYWLSALARGHGEQGWWPASVYLASPKTWRSGWITLNVQLVDDWALFSPYRKNHRDRFIISRLTKRLCMRWKCRAKSELIYQKFD